MDVKTPRLAALDDRADMARLDAAAADEDAGLNDVARADLAAPRPGSATWLLPDGLAHVQRDTRAPSSWLLGVSAPRAAWPALLECATAHVIDNGGGTITWWCAGASDADIAAARACGWSVARRQHELRARLPLGPDVHASARVSSDVQLRAIRPGDADGVLAVNNAAFAGHPEQGGWTRATLDERMAQPWFDPDLFVVAERVDGRIVGFNWLKPHAATASDVARGEIYVIAVDPAVHGKGLGRLLAVEGLDRLHARGFGWASLFVAADNDTALALYDRLGFTPHRTDVAFELVTAAP